MSRSPSSPTTVRPSWAEKLMNQIGRAGSRISRRPTAQLMQWCGSGGQFGGIHAVSDSQLESTSFCTEGSWSDPAITTGFRKSGVVAQLVKKAKVDFCTNWLRCGLNLVDSILSSNRDVKRRYNVVPRKS